MHFTNLGSGLIEKVCSKEQSRYTINHVYFDADKGHLAATNGNALVITHVIPDTGETSGWITAEALQEYRKALKTVPVYSSEPGKYVSIQAIDDKIIVANHFDGKTVTFRRPEKGNFPNFEAVMPKVTGDPIITFDITLLQRIVDALGRPSGSGADRSNFVAIWPGAKDGAYLVKTHPNGALGVMMPMRSDSEKGKWLTSVKAVDDLLKNQQKAEENLAKAEVHEFPTEGSEEEESNVSPEAISAAA